MWICIPEVLEGPEVYGGFFFPCKFWVYRQYKLLPCREEACPDINHLAKLLASGEDGKSEREICTLELKSVNRDHLTKPLQALSVLSGHNILFKWTRQSLSMARTTPEACVYLPSCVALCKLQVFLFWFRSDSIYNCILVQSEPVCSSEQKATFCFEGKPVFQELLLLRWKTGLRDSGNNRTVGSIKKKNKHLSNCSGYFNFFSTQVSLYSISMSRWSNKTFFISHYNKTFLYHYYSAYFTYFYNEVAVSCSKHFSRSRRKSLARCLLKLQTVLKQASSYCCMRENLDRLCLNPILI